MEDNDKLNYYTDTLLWLDCTQKIVLALLDKDSIIQYLAHVHVGIIQDVLAFPFRRIDDGHQHEHLNATFCEIV